MSTTPKSWQKPTRTTMKKIQRLPLSPLFRHYNDVAKAHGLHGASDCAIRTVACIADKPYMEVYDWVAAHTSYTAKEGLLLSEMPMLLDHFGIVVEQLCLDHAAKFFGCRLTCYTPDRFPNKWRNSNYPGQNTYVAYCSGGTHIFPIVDGQVMDWTRGRRFIITDIYRVVE